MTLESDVIVVGAGSAGAAAAWFCARQGLSVRCLEAKSLDRAGACWVNSVPTWTMLEAGIPLPAAPERVSVAPVHRLVAGWGPHSIAIRDGSLVQMDMRRLVARLQSLAQGAGARLVEGARVLSLQEDTVQTTAGAYRARWFIDASGMTGARLLGQSRIPLPQVCSAIQEARHLTDFGAAAAFLDSIGARPGEAISFAGVAGGYSTLSILVAQGRVDLLAGTIPAEGQPSGPALLRQFVRDHAWIGRRIFGGARCIPIRRPRTVLASERVAIIGDAACQVFPAHGSGIGQGLLAARMVADCLVESRDLRSYCVRYQRRYGGTLAAYDVFRRFSQRLDSDSLARMMRSGLFNGEAAASGLVQRYQPPPASAVLQSLRAMTRAPREAWMLANVLAKMAAIGAHYMRFPDDPAQWPNWSRWLRRLEAQSWSLG